MEVICYILLAFYVSLSFNGLNIQLQSEKHAVELFRYDSTPFNNRSHVEFDVKFEAKSSVGVVISSALYLGCDKRLYLPAGSSVYKPRTYRSNSTVLIALLLIIAVSKPTRDRASMDSSLTLDY